MGCVCWGSFSVVVVHWFCLGKPLAVTSPSPSPTSGRRGSDSEPPQTGPQTPRAAHRPRLPAGPAESLSPSTVAASEPGYLTESPSHYIIQIPATTDRRNSLAAHQPQRACDDKSPPGTPKVENFFRRASRGENDSAGPPSARPRYRLQFKDTTLQQHGRHVSTIVATA